MHDGLVYRFPGEPVHAFSGKWRKIAFNELNVLQQAFVVSNAAGDELVVFDVETPCELDCFPVTLSTTGQQKPTDENAYRVLLQAMLDEMTQDELPKVVFSRIDVVPAAVDVIELFKELESSYPQTLVYYMQSEEWGCWIGASPETLLQQVGDEAYRTMALAGTLPADAVQAKWSDKEIKEQEYVVEYIKDVIEAFGSMIDITARKEVVAGPVKHLRTDFILNLSGYNVPSFIQRLHPTPAVCGIPKDRAERCYEKYESHDRRLYTGFLGWWSKEKLHLFVNLRCMQCFSNELNLFVGGGITADSDPLHEWEETDKKAQTLKQFIQQ